MSAALFPVPSSLAHTQAAWAAYLRAPTPAALPAGTAPQRMQHYAQLLHNNISGFMHQCFPVARSLLPVAQWQALITQFFAKASNASPYFYEIPQQFVDFWQARPDALEPWFLELLHYEYLELAVDTATDAPVQFGAQGWALNPSVQLAGYAWPVHTISKTHIPKTPDSTFVALYRNAELRVRFSVLTPAAMQLLVFLQSNGCDWLAAQKTLAQVLGQDLSAVQSSSHALQAQWLHEGLLLQAPSGF